MPVTFSNAPFQGLYKILWVKAVDKGGKYPFSETILRCTEDNP